MSRQSDEEFARSRDISSHSAKECIRLEGDRTPVKKDDLTIHDDVNDYVFLKAKKTKKHKDTSDKKNSSDDFPFVKSERGHRRRKKKMKKWKKILIAIGCTLLAFVLIIIGTFSVLLYRGNKQLYENDNQVTAPEGVEVQDDGQYVVYKGETYKLNEEVTNILFMGIDKRNIDETTETGTGGQADVIVLAAVNSRTGKVTLINVSRDIMTDVAMYSAGGSYIGMDELQICLAYAYGDGKETSCENTVNAVERIFYNIPINSYYSLDLDGIAAINDSIGGVDVTSPETIGTFVKGESYHLEGSMAESFVRTRDQSVVDANTLRMERQKIFINAFMQKVVSQVKQDITAPLDLFNAASEYSYTNLNASKVCYLAEEMITTGNFTTEMSSVPGEVVMGDNFAEFYIDEEEFYELFLSVYYEKVE